MKIRDFMCASIIFVIGVLLGMNIMIDRECYQASQEAAEATSFEYTTKLMTVTAYCACTKCCGPWADGITANGYVIQPGDRFVAAPKEYSFGTQMLIPGYSNNKLVTVLDRGGAIKGDKIDVYFDTHQEALAWGVQKLTVKIY